MKKIIYYSPYIPIVGIIVLTLLIISGRLGDFESAMCDCKTPYIRCLAIQVISWAIVLTLLN